MSRLRSLLVAVGVGASLLGLATTIEPGLATIIVATNVFVPILGFLALFQGYRMLQRRKGTEIRATETPDLEISAATDAPGASFDRQLAAAAGYRRSTLERRDRIRRRLREVATATIQRRMDCSREEALAQLDDGTWTDDSLAASMLGASVSSNQPLVGRIRIAFSTESRFQRSARHTADAIASIDRGDRR